MEDLSELDWTASDRSSIPPKLPPMNPPSYYPSLRPTPPLSGRSTPATFQPSSHTFKPPTAPIPRSNSSTPANDSFANLVTFNASLSSKNPSLEEQHKALEARKAREQQLQKKQSEIKIEKHEGEFWDYLEGDNARRNLTRGPSSYVGTDARGGQSLSNTINKPFGVLNGITGQSITKNDVHDNDDLLSGIASPPIDQTSSSNHVSKKPAEPFAVGNETQNPYKLTAISLQKPKAAQHDQIELLNDDPFGLGTVENTGGASIEQAIDPVKDDDILGLLARPVSEFSVPSKVEDPSPEPTNAGFSSSVDHAIAELVDMGFSPEKSKEALETTNSGIDVQAAVGWLLSQAHEDSKKNSQVQQRLKITDTRKNSQHKRISTSSWSSDDDTPRPPWMKEQTLPRKEISRQSSRSPVNGEKDTGKFAAELGNNLFKTANSIWKTGAKKLNKAVSDLNSDSDSGQPKWMRETQAKSEDRRSKPQIRHERANDPNGLGNAEPWRIRENARGVTDEALMLESGDNRPPPRKPLQQPKETLPPWSSNSSGDQSPVIPKPKEPTLLQLKSSQQPSLNDTRAKLNRRAIEDQSSNPYISPARRKKLSPKPVSPEPDLLFDESQAKPGSESSSSTPNPKSSISVEAQTPTQNSYSRPSSQPRPMPQISPSALRTSTINRHEGTSAFKRGNYALATTYYTTALSSLPSSHPLAIVMFTNRALSHLKTGDPKSSIADAKSALALIGPSQGSDESINLGEEGSKEMKEFWTKAMTRQAEALEQLEQWSDAAVLWKSCIEAGVGGAVSRAGRSRCEKAAIDLSNTTKTPKPSPAKKGPLKPARKSSALADLSGKSSQVSAEAVLRLRQANLEAERIDEEKFALSDQVSERLAHWREARKAIYGPFWRVLKTYYGTERDGKRWAWENLLSPAKLRLLT